MSLVSKLLIAAGSICLCLVGFQTAKAVPMDLGASRTVLAGTPLYFHIPTGVGGGNAAGPYNYEFIVDGQMGHIELTQGTNLNLHVASFFVNPGGIEFPYSYDLSDMNHDPLPNTDRAGELLGLFGGVPQGPVLGSGQEAIDDPIDPADLEQGRYFHDIHFDLPAVPDLQIIANNAALVFDQNVQLGVWVPEPGSFAALGSLAAVGLCFGVSRRRRPAKK